MHLFFPDYTVKSEDGEKAALAQVKLVHELQRSHRFSSVFFCHPSLTSVISLEHCVAKILEPQAELRVET